MEGDSKEAAGRVEWATMNLESGGTEKADGAVGNASRKQPVSIFRLFMACMVSGGIQYGWALQLSLLSPYSQTLGIPHSFVSLTWICGPIAGFVVQPIVGYYSDRCTSKIGRRRPFILAGCIIICVSVLMIGFSSDIGRHLGDTKEHCSTFTGSRWSAAAVYIVGFWFLDFANNTVQGPGRAMMADLSAGQHGPNVGQAIFSLWMALGSVLGYLSGANAKWPVWLPWLKTAACCDACANLKGAFLTAVIIIIITMSVTLAFAGEEPLSKDDVVATSSDGACSAFGDLFKSLKNLPPAMFSVLAVTAVTWLSWFPFFQYDTDWMGREIYRGEPQGPKADIFDAGVREGAVGLIFTSIALGVTSFLIPKLCRKLTSRVVWSISNLMVFVLMTVMVVVGMLSMKGYKPALTATLTGPDPKFRGIALAVFALMGIPQAVLFSVPWAVASEVTSKEGGGQGLSIGVLNIAIVLPQLVISLTAGPIDGAFNKGNTPAFGIGAAFALICTILALFMLPKTRGVSSAAMMAGGH
ncbi:Sucrose transport protein SUT5 [Dichanthelium oligosanthes]|uniref:Sucrose transport protein SUT5 n=1 Tax=Dichanthelium oligosanthes TaxID=888268 RepID=A0A1E5UUF2_9POAL|nr:Sucrose transport protein SUT5 [Dichanthelium oligosanthes]